MSKIEVYLTQWCPYCARARQLLGEKGQAWTEIDIEAEPGRRAMRCRDQPMRLSLSRTRIENGLALEVTKARS